MILVDPVIQAATRRAIYRGCGGLTVSFRRIIGVAPQASVIDANVRAVVRKFMIDASGGAREGFTANAIGAITVGDREVLVMADDLVAEGFPLPVAKGDRIFAESGEEMTVSRVDPFKRAVAGCLEIIAFGV